MKMKNHRSRIIAQIKPVLGLIVQFVLVAVTFSYAMFQGGFVSWFLFFSFIPFAIYSILLLIYPIKEFGVERTLEAREFGAGDHVNVKLTLTRKRAFPILFLIVEDILPKGINTDQHKQVIFPGFKKMLSYSYRIENVPRGEHVFEGVRLMAGDALGLTEKEHWFDCQQTILVYPRYEELTYRPLESRFEQGGTASALQFQKDTTLVAGVREYQPGDRFSWIDWKATARKQELVSKEFEIRQTNDLLLVLDRTASPSFEEAVVFAASATNSILSHGGQVGLFSVGADKTFIPIRGGEQQQKQIFHHLAKVKPDSDLQLANILESETVIFRQPAVLLVITSKLDQEFIKSAGLFLRRRGTIIVYYIRKRGEQMNEKELQMKSAALYKGLIIKTLYEDEFRTAFTEVERA
ncbi:MAG TPA: DUF58 domain-containing protein [Bacillaceae bacterium]|uniref:DUF58 domain-containing protein n=2 Tax=Lederbergia graminis TaxID=735518 RepID=A0ABW0LH13_9BACI|nr:DUF58 domain-containing protein [Bacillaceae bacterium]